MSIYFIPSLSSLTTRNSPLPNFPNLLNTIQLITWGLRGDTDMRGLQCLSYIFPIVDVLSASMVSYPLRILQDLRKVYGPRPA